MVKRILIAEDEISISKALQDKLQQAGFEVKVVPNGHEVLEILAKEKFDLLLLDLIMPRLDGYSVLKEIRQQGLNLKIIVLSNLGQSSDIEKIKELAVDDYWVKSEISLADIVKNLQKL